MSNASLKEQLQSLGLSISGNEKPSPSNKRSLQPSKVVKNSIEDRRDRNVRTMKNVKHNPKQNPKQTPKPAWLEQAQYGVELLKAHFPKCFKDMKDIQPLKIGIKQDLVKHLSTREEIVTSDKACMVNSLSYYVNSPAYHKRVVEGAARIDLEGEAVGVISADEAKYSIDCRAAKLQKKQNQLDKKKSGVSPSMKTTPSLEKESPQKNVTSSIEGDLAATSIQEMTKE